MANESALSMESFDTGFSKDGMDTYIENLKVSLITETATKINNVEDIEAALNAGWQGVSKDKFLKDFADERQKVIDDLEKEFKNLEARLAELQAAYFNFDEKMYKA